MLVQEKSPFEKARSRAERPGTKGDVPAAMFEKVLRAFALGDLSFADLQASLTRLLKDGASPDELLRLLHLRDAIEPLQADVRDKIIAALHEALPAGFAKNDGVQHLPVPAVTALPDSIQAPADDEPDNSAMSRLIQEFAAAWDTEPKARPAPPAAASTNNGQNVDYRAMRIALGQREDDLAALQAEHSRVLGLLEARARSAAQLQEELRELSGHFAAARGALETQQGKTREVEEVLAERVAAEDAARTRVEQARNEEAARQADLHRKELSALRESLAARDASIETARRTLAERDAAIEHSSRALVARDGVIEQARGLLAERDTQIAARDAQIAEREAQIAARDALIAERNAHIGARDAQIARLQGEQSKLAPTLESGAQLAATLQADLAAAQARIAALESETELAKTQSMQPILPAGPTTYDGDQWADKVLALQRSLDESSMALEAQKQQHSKIVSAFMSRAKSTEIELKAARARIEAMALELQVRDHAAASVRVREREQVQVQEQQQETGPDLEQTMPLLPIAEPGAPGLQLRRGVEISDFSSPPRRPPPARQPWRPSSLAGTVGICAAIAVLAVIAWVKMHHAPSAPTAPEVAAAPSPAPGTVIRDCPTCPAFTVLPAGRFKQGSADSSASATVKPLHWVAISQPIAMSTNAVTVDQFRSFATATNRDMQGCDTYDGHWKHQPKSNWQNPGFEQSGTHPVTCASWSDAKAYAQWLSDQTGHHYRLPSASEWEYAARAGSEASQPWNASGADACANANVADLSAAHRYPGWVAFACNDGYVFTAPVGSFKANAFSLNDMLGNVFQWTEDCWSASYKGAPIDGSARADGNCTEHELRGGSWFSSPGYVRADYRNHFPGNYRTSSAGIRLVRDITP